MNLRWAIAVLVLVVAGIVVYDRIRHAPLPEGLVQTNGRIEGDTIAVAGKYPGKVTERLVEEGDKVQAGQVVVRLDDEEAQARLKQAEAAVAALEAQRNAAETGLEVLRRDVPLGIAMAQAEVQARGAALKAAQEAEAQMRKDRERMKDLAARGSVEAHREEEMSLRWQSALAELRGAQAGRLASEKQLSRARLRQDEIVAREKELQAISAQINQVKAALEEAKVAVGNLVIHAPANGTVVAKLVEPGEVVAAGTPLLEIVDLEHLYLKAYVEGRYLGKLKVGLPARLYVDAFPDKSFPAELRYIASKAEFTPKEVQTPEERTKLVYATKIYLTENTGGLLTPGMSADAVIRWKEGVSWQKPRW